MSQKKNQPGCPCCSDPCVEPVVSITGYNLSTSEGPTGLLPCDDCCWYREFALPLGSGTTFDDCFIVCNNGTNSRYIVHRRVTLAVVIEVWLSRSTCDCTPPSPRYILSSRVRDNVDYQVWWNYGDLFGPVPTCPVPCPPTATLTPSTCQWIFQGGCLGHEVHWFRQKLYSTSPTGSITFTNSDLQSCLLHTAPNIYKLPCTTDTHAGITVGQTVTRDLVTCVNTYFPGVCTGTNNQSVTFSAPSWTISIT